MLEGGQIGWDPPVQTALSWGPRLFVFYLVFVLFVGVMRSVKLARYFWFSALRTSAVQGRSALTANRRGTIELPSFRRLSFLTLLLSILVVVIWTSQILENVATSRYFGPAPIFASLAQELQLLSLGVGVCTFLYILAILWDGVLRRRRNLSDP